MSGTYIVTWLTLIAIFNDMEIVWKVIIYNALVKGRSIKFWILILWSYLNAETGGSWGYVDFTDAKLHMDTGC
jgi:hypothetical protein